MVRLKIVKKNGLNSCKASSPQYIRYKGMVPFNQSTEVLKNYDALLFPTYYEGEGFAGTIIDAFAAGLPVIASDWKVQFGDN
ncbi:MAG: glycosyltransferase [Blautia sp.]